MTQEQAFTVAFDEFGDALFRHCFFRVSDRERAKEIVQDTFMKTWDYVAKGGEVKQYKAFLYRVANNLIIDEYRKKKSESLDALLEQDGVQEGTFDELHYEDNLEEQLDLAREAEQLKKELKSLPEEYQAPVTMRYIDGLSPKEIAEALGESTNTISVRIHRGIARLKKEHGYA